MYMQRIIKEIDLIIKDFPEWDLKIDERNASEWILSFPGASDTIYEKYLIELKIKIPLCFPIDPPLIFINHQNFFHPNVDYNNGNICLSVLKKSGYYPHCWSSIMHIYQIVLTISSLLVDSQITMNQINPNAANLYLNDRETYDKKVIEWLEKFCVKI